MPILHVYVNDKTMERLKRAARETARSVEDLAEAAVSEEAVRYATGRSAPTDA